MRSMDHKSGLKAPPTKHNNKNIQIFGGTEYNVKIKIEINVCTLARHKFDGAIRLANMPTVCRKNFSLVNELVDVGFASQNALYTPDALPSFI